MMQPDPFERLQARTGRRSFLRGSAWLVAAVGASAVAPIEAWAQQPPEPAPPADEAARREKSPEDEKNNRTDKGEPSEKTDKKDTAKEGDGEKTYVGADGRPYRVCPVCGANMYRQDRTWTCENCGYSYVE